MKNKYKIISLIILICCLFISTGFFMSRIGPWWGMKNQASNPSATTNGIKLFSSSTNKLTSIDSNSVVSTLSGVLDPNGRYHDITFDGAGTIATTSNGDINLIPGGSGDIEVGADDDIVHLKIHDAGTIIMNDDSDDVTVTLGPITDGTASLPIGPLTFAGATNITGIAFGSLGTANYGIRMDNSGLNGDGDYFIYMASDQCWRADNRIICNILQAATKIETVKFGSFADPGFMIFDTATTVGVGIGEMNPVGSLSDCNSNGTTTITKTAHGLSVAAGDLVHIRDATTSADEGFYRLVSTTVDTLVVDRALSGSDTDVDLRIYKDVIGFFNTDGINGQRMMGYSHQDKPLQLGGDIPVATGFSLGSEDIHICGNKLEIDPPIRVDNTMIYNPSSAQMISVASDAITVSATMTVLDPNHSWTLTSTPTIADGTTGQIVFITCANAETDTITVQDEDTLPSSNLELGAATRAISGKDVLQLIFDGTDWIEVSYANN